MAADHVIIGSGINGLVAAALLALKGDKVTVLEREDRLGGCLFTDQATLPGFNHDVMAATWVLFMTSPAGAALGPETTIYPFTYVGTGAEVGGGCRLGPHASVARGERVSPGAVVNALVGTGA